MKTHMLFASAASLFALASVAGCASSSAGTGDEAASPDGTEVAASSAQSSRMEEMIVEPIGSQDPIQAAASVAAAQWWPAGCASRQKDATNPAVVHIHLNDCTGPFGLRHHTGDITVTFSKNANGSLHAQSASSNMTVNGAVVTWSRDKDITISGSTRTVTSTGAWTRVNAKGDTVSHTSNMITVVDLGTKCRTSNGSAVTSVGSREIDSSIKDYKICRGADGAEGCPSGTVIHSHKTSGRSETVTFDGTATATIAGPKRSLSVSLVCGQ